MRLHGRSKLSADAGATRSHKRVPLRYRAAAGFGLTALVLSSTFAVIVYAVITYRPARKTAAAPEPTAT